MTFVSETVRLLFHQLPADTQVRYAELENRLAKNGQGMQIDAVMQLERILEVVIRVSQQYSFHVTPRPSIPTSNDAGKHK